MSIIRRKRKAVKVLSASESDALISAIGRAEMYEHPRAYLKAVRATLISLGYHAAWVNGRFRKDLERAYFPEWYSGDNEE